MKMFFVVYEEYFDDRVTHAFKQAGMQTYMKFHDTTGKDAPSKASPGILHSSREDKLFSLLMPVPDEEILHLVEIVRKLKAEYPIVGIRAFTFPLEEVV
jgi:hypothetical protein